MLKGNEIIKLCKGHGNLTMASAMFWQLLETVPISCLLERGEGRWRPVYRPNLGKARNIPPFSKILWSILQRMKLGKDMEITNSSLFFKRLQQIIKTDHDITIRTLDASQTLVSNLNDLIDTKHGFFKVAIQNFIIYIGHKAILLDLDRENPPNKIN